MASVGEQLRQAREQAGLTLSDVAARTKIQRWILEDIERDDLSRVPGGVFVRGYLSSFARVVGIDAEPLLTDYRAATQTVEPAPVVERAEVPIVSRWTIVRVAAIVSVAAFMWMNAPHKKSNSTSVAVAPAPASAPRTTAPAAPEVVPVAATTGSTAEPPKVLACINKLASTHNAVSKSKVFCVNVLRAEDWHLSTAFSGACSMEWG